LAQLGLHGKRFPINRLNLSNRISSDRSNAPLFTVFKNFVQIMTYTFHGAARFSKLARYQSWLPVAGDFAETGNRQKIALSVRHFT
jgi:hypothetical protein